MDIYKYAAQHRLRFPSVKGAGGLTAEQLFDLPLLSKVGPDLNTVAKTISGELRAMGEETFVSQDKPDPKKEQLGVALDVVKDVIKTKEANRAALAKSQRAAERVRILDAMQKKNEQALSDASMDELKKKLAELDD